MRTRTRAAACDSSTGASTLSRTSSLNRRGGTDVVGAVINGEMRIDREGGRNSPRRRVVVRAPRGLPSTGRGTPSPGGRRVRVGSSRTRSVQVRRRLPRRHPDGDVRARAHEREWRERLRRTDRMNVSARVSRLLRTTRAWAASRELRTTSSWSDLIAPQQASSTSRAGGRPRVDAEITWA